MKLRSQPGLGPWCSPPSFCPLSVSADSEEGPGRGSLSGTVRAVSCWIDAGRSAREA